MQALVFSRLIGTFKKNRTTFHTMKTKSVLLLLLAACIPFFAFAQTPIRISATPSVRTMTDPRLLQVATQKEQSLANTKLVLTPPKISEVFDVAEFEKRLKAGFTGKVPGFSYAISTGNGVKAFGGVGSFRLTQDKPELAANANIPLYVASMNKTITAAALIKLLGEKGISLDATMAPYLPTDWKKGTGISTITFRHLLTHNTRFTETTWWQFYPELKAMVAAGAVDKEVRYRNVNYNLMRVLIASLLGFTPGTDDTKNSETSAKMYRDYVQTAVLSKCLISPEKARYTHDPNAVAPLNYPNPWTGKNGITTGDLSLNSGAQGIYLSALNYAQALNYILFTDNVLNATQRKAMFDGNLGMFSQETPRGKAWNHSGYLPQDGNGGAFLGSWYIFPGEVRLVLLLNTEIEPGTLSTLITDAYNGSWKVVAK
jgi:CubicO group peptidase (beta-lactamase class C family)